MKFLELPLVIRVATGVSFVTAWVVFEETIVDRHGLWRFMPGYTVGDPCIWDIGAIGFTIGVLALISRCSCKRCAPVAPF